MATAVAGGFAPTAESMVAAFPTINFIPLTIPPDQIATATGPDLELIQCHLDAAGEWMEAEVCGQGCLDSLGEQARLRVQFQIALWFLHTDCKLDDDASVLRHYRAAVDWLKRRKACCDHVDVESVDTGAGIATCVGGDHNREFTEETLWRYTWPRRLYDDLQPPYDDGVYFRW